MENLILLFILVTFAVGYAGVEFNQWRLKRNIDLLHENLKALAEDMSNALAENAKAESNNSQAIIILFQCQQETLRYLRGERPDLPTLNITVHHPMAPADPEKWENN